MRTIETNGFSIRSSLMRSTKQFSITLANEMAKALRAKVASGEYATESEVICDGLRLLMARDQAVEAWLKTEVVDAYDAYKAAPSRAISASKLHARLVPLGRPRKVKFGVLKGKLRYPVDFDAPLPARVLALFDGRRTNRRPNRAPK
jgi:antitoxin ParD1/3/4